MSQMYSFDDAHHFAARLAEAPEIVEDEMLTATNRSLNTGISMAKEKIEDNESIATGDMHRSVGIQEAATFSAGMASGAFGPSVDYAKLVEDGRGEVVAKEGGALVFTPHPKYGIPVKAKGKFTGMAVFKRVKAAEAKPFMEPTARRLGPKVREEFSGAVKRMIGRVVE